MHCAMKMMKMVCLTGLLAVLCACAPARKAVLLSYNVHNCIGLDKVRDYERIARVINEAAPDVAALQELDSATLRNGGVNALAELARLTGMHGIFGAAIPFQGGKYGIGLLSRERPLKYRIVPMPGREEERALIVAEFKDYVFCATHQSLTPDDQLASVALIEQELAGIDKPVFLAGDMNSTPSSQPQLQLARTFVCLNDTAAFTFPADRPDRCIDYIYVDRRSMEQVELKECRVLNEPQASDHRPVLVKLLLE